MERPMTVVRLRWKETRAYLRARLRAWTNRRLAVLAFSLALGLVGSAHAADAVKGELNVTTDGGYARLMFRLDDQVDAKVAVSGAILVISFKRPVEVSVDRINSSAPDYVSAARQDPDRTAIRIALARKVKVNLIPAAERLYVDLLPENWKGVMPGLPQEVVDDLSRRAREAERQLRQQRLSEKQNNSAMIRVKVARQPTFIRYVFDVPGAANVVPERTQGKLTLNFDQQIKWDMADVKATIPSTLESVEAETDFSSATVTFTLNGTPNVHTFREDRSLIVDVGLDGARPKAETNEGAAVVAAPSAPAIEPPETVPAKEAATAEAAVKAAENPPSAPKQNDAPAPALAPAPKQNDAPKVAAKAEPAQPTSPPVPAFLATAPSASKDVAKEASKNSADAAASQAPRLPINVNGDVVAAVTRSGDSLRVEFPFAGPTPTAVFRRSDQLWLVFDSAAAIDVTAIASEINKDIVRAAVFERGQDGEGIVRIRLERPQLASLEAVGPGWAITIADTVTVPTRPLAIARSIVGKGRSSIAIPFDDARKVHRIKDPDVGDNLMVITALGPARGFLKPQDFVELHALPSTHGVVVQPVADDIGVELAVDKITISRPAGLSLSTAAIGSQEQAAPTVSTQTFDTQLWGFDREAKFNDRQSELIRMAASAPESRRKAARFNLARFYLARDMAPEAKAVIDVALTDQRGADDITGSVLRAIAFVMLDRPEDALKELAGAQIGNQQDAPIWRAIAYARQGKWPEARAAFKTVENAIAALPIELQRMAMQQSLRSAIEVRDFTGATRTVNDFETIGVPPEMEASIAVLAGRIYEGLGRKDDALSSYRAAAAATNRRAAAQGRLRELVLLFGAGEIPRKDMLRELETLTTVWRGDETEVEGLKVLAHLYTEEGRYRDAFHTMRTAMMAHPNSDLTRKIQDEAAVTFGSLFLAGKGDALSPVEALGLFYDFRELTPIGRRGDEMIRRLADRLVSVDLLDQAAELLQHQVDHRLQGAGRAQVATRLAIIYLMNHKADRALAALQSTRSAELSNELRDERLLLEARALSEMGRHDVALELIPNIKGRQATRLHSDILWSARRWRDAAEQIELMYGDRWRDFTPLTDAERGDILRAAIGYSLDGEAIGLARLREKYAAKMADGPDRRAFDVVSAPIGTSGEEFQDIAKRVASVDTLDAFLRDMRARYPDSASAVTAATAKGGEAPVPATPAAVPAAKPLPPKTAANAPAKPDSAASPLPPKVPAGVPLKPDQSPTGSIGPRLPKPRPKGL
jgi:tetratricopeptide (TPR) repeat protein